MKNVGGWQDECLTFQLGLSCCKILQPCIQSGGLSLSVDFSTCQSLINRWNKVRDEKKKQCFRCVFECVLTFLGSCMAPAKEDGSNYCHLLTRYAGAASRLETRFNQWPCVWVHSGCGCIRQSPRQRPSRAHWFPALSCRSQSTESCIYTSTSAPLSLPTLTFGEKKKEQNKQVK